MNTSSSEHPYEIVNGPNRDSLFDACKYVHDSKAKVNIDFEVVAAYTMPRNDPGCAYVRLKVADFKILAIEHEDGSGQSFNLHGYCRANLDSFNSKPDDNSSRDYSWYKFAAYYNSKKRIGTISFVKR